MKTKNVLLLISLLTLVNCANIPPQSFTLIETSISDIQRAINSGDTTCRQVVEGYIARINAYDQPNGINAISLINPNALNKADEADASIAKGETLPPLFCAPLLIKDNFDTHDMVTTGGSITLKNSIPPDDAFMVRKLREAGAIILAKTNMAEWAFTPQQTVSSTMGRTANAYDTDYVPSGSSGGTASGVATSFGVAGMGTDTGNSIRGPSSHLALFGIRSTIGLTSRDGVIPLYLDRDIAGPMTRTVEDGARIFDIVASFDPSDSLSVPDKREENYTDFLNADGLNGKRLGILRTLVDQEDADPEIKSIFFKAVEDMKEAGAIIVDQFEIPELMKLGAFNSRCVRFRYDLGQYLQTLDSPPFLDVNTLLDTGEYAAPSLESLERNSQSPLDINPNDWEQPCPMWPNNPTRNRLLTNTITAMDAAGLDAIIYPSWSNPPAHIDKPLEEYKGENSHVLAPDTGLPAVTVPMGYWQNKLPAGLQILGRPYSEGLLIELAYSYEQKTLHRTAPEGFGEVNH
jgi:amidase